jgi:hypothetical protein
MLCRPLYKTLRGTNEIKKLSRPPSLPPSLPPSVLTLHQPHPQQQGPTTFHGSL